MTQEELTDRLWKELCRRHPPALLIGQLPNNLQKYNYVNQKPYEAVVIGRLTPHELLQMPTEPVCEALLEGIPVYLHLDQSFCRCPKGVLLKRYLYERMDRLLMLGVRSLPRGTGRTGNFC